MPDRESFVAAIAASPDDDLPRLVFADWLEENGDQSDQARALFIRTQIRWHHAESKEEKRHLNSRAAALCHDQWPRWFGPLLHALDPTADLQRWYQVYDAREAARVVRLTTMSRSATAPRAVESVSFSRGFVDQLTLHLPAWADGSLAEAFAHEPVHGLSCRNGLNAPVWRRFTDPALRRVGQFHLTQQWAWAVSAPDSGPLLDDPHLAGVRQFSLLPVVNDVTDPHPLPAPWVNLFVRSSLAYRLTGLSLMHIGDDAVPALCRPGRLHLERLELGGPLSAESVRRLGNSELADTVRELRLNGCQLGSGGVAALARGEWRKLTHLELRGNQLTLGGLRSFASAGFLGQLVSLDLSDNILFETAPESVEHGLRMLADALDPDRLEHLDLTDTGLSHLPEFLAMRFGERVKI